ncbi:R3H domain protein [Perilla frutescens var. hirtella]|nr:R3H domain protein [Perilla frutescens var. hirtella]
MVVEENVRSRGLEIEKKIDFLESLAGNVSNRRSRRWLNDRLLMELVPRLNAEEIRGLFAPPPWGSGGVGETLSLSGLVLEWQVPADGSGVDDVPHTNFESSKTRVSPAGGL